MKSKIMYRIIALILVVCILVMSLAGCSSASASANRTSFHIAFSALYMDATAVSEFSEVLASEMPELTIDGNAPTLTPIFAGMVENDFEAGIFHDPMMALSIMKIPMMVAAGELDVVVSTLDNAAREARSDIFLPLEEVLTAEELAQFSDRLLAFEHVDTDGYNTWPTGEMTPVCGINITGNEYMRQIFGNQEIGVFIVANTGNIELARSVMLSLAEL